MRKILSALLAAAMVFSVSAAAFAADARDMEGKTVILHTNDVHGAIEGYACIAALEAEYMARGAEVVTVDAGDFSQGSTYVSVSKGLDAVSMMNIAGYDYACLGNHEFDYGSERLIENMKSAEFEVLCSNVLDSNGELLFRDRDIYTTDGGAKLGFFGLETPSTRTTSNPVYTSMLTFLSDDTEEKLWDNAQKQIDGLREDGADIVICLSHLGSDDSAKPYNVYDLYESTKGLDFIIDAHSHTVMTEGANGEPIQSTGTKFENIGVIVIDEAKRDIESHSICPVTKDFPRDEKVSAAADAVINAVNDAYGTVFAKSEVELNGEKQASDTVANGNRDGETNLGDLVTDAMLWAVTEKRPGSITDVAAENIVAVNNGGGIRAPIHKGDVTKNDVLSVLPFGNTLSAVYVTGAELLEALEASTFCTPEPVGAFPQVSGLEYTVNTANKYNANEEPYPGSTYYGPASINRVTINSVNGKPFSMSDKYAVLTNDFCAVGGDSYYAFAAASGRFDTGLSVDAIVMEYITEKLGGVIGEQYKEPQGRIAVISEPAVAEEKVERLAGDTRIETAVAISREGWADGAKNVILASAQSYADSLAATPLAYALDAPVLLTSGGKKLEEVVSAELKRLGAENVYIVGGENVVSTVIETALDAERIAGADRYETSLRIAEKLARTTAKKSSDIFFTSGENYPDALAAGPVAALGDMPILYINADGSLDKAVAEFAGTYGRNAYLLGGTAAVAEDGFKAIDAVCGDVERIAGADRYETAEKIYSRFASYFSGKCAVIATGASFPDALAGGVFAAKNSAAVSLTADKPGDAVLKRAQNSEKVYILGGENAVSSDIEKAIAA